MLTQWEVRCDQARSFLFFSKPEVRQSIQDFVHLLWPSLGHLWYDFRKKGFIGNIWRYELIII